MVSVDEDTLDPTNVINWHGRPVRKRRRPVTYWEEFVATDEWYQNEMIADVPESELYDALVDENFQNDVGDADDAIDEGGDEADDSTTEADDSSTGADDSATDDLCKSSSASESASESDSDGGSSEGSSIEGQ